MRFPRRLLGFALAAVTACATGAAPAGAVFLGNNGKIAYTDNTVGGADIMLADANGTVDVSNNPASEQMPRWSPDGKQLLWLRFVPNSNGGQVPKIVVANADGSGQRQVTVGDSEETSPSWSSDGRSIAYRSHRPDGSDNIYVIGADGTGERRVTDSATTGILYDQPQWSPSGFGIAATANQLGGGGSQGISRIDSGTGAAVPLTSTAGDTLPAWAPDGDSLVFVRSNALYLVSQSGGDAREVVRAQALVDGVPWWTADGTRVGFWDNGGPGVVAYRLDGTDPRTVAATTWADIDWEPCSTNCHPLAGLDSATVAGTPAALPPPVAGVSANVVPVRGKVLVRLPGKRAFAPLSAALHIPIGSAVDTTAGTVRLASGRPGGGTQQADFENGTFVVRQRKTSPRVDLALSGALACTTRARSAKRKRAPRVRHLWGDGKGQFRTVGKYSATAVRGTRWFVEDRCDGTLTRVARGVVSVQDFVRNRTVTVRAGHSYLAKRRR